MKLHELKKALETIKYFNEIPLAELAKIMRESGMVVTETEIKEWSSWKFTGLTNVDFYTSYKR